MKPTTIDQQALTSLRPGRYRADLRRVSVRLRTRHLFGLGAVTGSVQARELTLEITHDQLGVHAVLDAASIDTGSARRDRDVRSARYLDVAAYPDIVFEAARLLHRDDGLVVEGALTAHGVEAPLDLVITSIDASAGPELHITSVGLVDRFAHGVTAGRGFAARRLTVEVDVVAVRDEP